MRLTAEQLNHFETFGFLIFRQLLTGEEMALYGREFDTALDSWTDEGQHDRKKRHYASLMEQESPFIASQADDSRFGDVAEHRPLTREGKSAPARHKVGGLDRFQYILEEVLHRT